MNLVSRHNLISSIDEPIPNDLTLSITIANFNPICLLIGIESTKLIDKMGIIYPLSDLRQMIFHGLHIQLQYFQVISLDKWYNIFSNAVDI
jgi:hypothetical protein